MTGVSYASWAISRFYNGLDDEDVVMTSYDRARAITVAAANVALAAAQARSLAWAA